MKNRELRRISFDTATDAQMEADLLQKKRQLLPEMKDENPGSRFMRLLDLISRYFGRWIRQFINGTALELFLGTAQTHTGISEGCRRLGYPIRQVSPAKTNLTITLSRDLSHGLILNRSSWKFQTARFPDGSDPVSFEMENASYVISGSVGNTFRIPIIQGRTIENEPLGISEGEDFEEYYTLLGNVIPESLTITAGGVAYTVTDNLLLADPWDLVFEIRGYTEDGQAIIAFGSGDGVSTGHGKKPGSGDEIVSPSYRILPDDENGNVSAGSISRVVPNTSIFTVNNSDDAEGWEAREDDSEAKWKALRYTRVRDGLGRLEDYEALAEDQDEISRAYAVSREFGENTIGVHCIKADGSYPDQDELDIISSAINLSPSGTVARACRPVDHSINITALVEVEEEATPGAVLSAVEEAIQDYFDPLNRNTAGNYTAENGSSVSQGLIYRIIMGVDGVAGCTIQAPVAIIGLNKNELPILGDLSIEEA